MPKAAGGRKLEAEIATSPDREMRDLLAGLAALDAEHAMRLAAIRGRQGAPADI